MTAPLSSVCIVLTWVTHSLMIFHSNWSMQKWKLVTSSIRLHKWSVRYFLFRSIWRLTESSPTKSSWWKWSDVLRTSAESTLKKTRWQGKYAAGYKKVQTGLDHSPTPAVLWRDALHTRNQMFQKSSHFCFAMISTDMRSQKQSNLPILLTTSTRPGTGNFLFPKRFEENEQESTMLAKIHRSH